MRMSFQWMVVGVAAASWAPLAGAQESLALAPIVVLATRIAQSSADLPASIDRIDRETIQVGQPQVNLSESLMTVPGVSAESRQNYAQDLQLSVRGFGARSSFGVRGVRLYSDGIPGTMPDGQGQFSQFDLGSADHIEVLRGPFSALYGNSSGGVISLVTEDGLPGHAVQGTVEYGTFNQQRYALKASGDDGVVNYLVDVAHFQTDGYRDHSDAERNNINGKLRFAAGEGSVTVVGNAVETPFVGDPLGLTRAQLAADPAQAGVGAVQYDTRKSLGQEQLGVVLDDPLSVHDELDSTVYTGHRATTQYQAIPKATELLSPLNPGGVIDLDRAFWGVDAHLTDRREFGNAPFQIVGGISYDDLAEARQGFLNFAGPVLGVEGALRRNEANHVYDFDQYLQAQWDPQPRWRLLAGVRNSTVDVSSHNELPGVAAPDSGVRYSAVNPVGGITYRATSAANLYASYGRGFETPTLNDLAYRSTNGTEPGLNLALRPARSDNYEAGAKISAGHVRMDTALFYIETRDELAVLANSNGRSVEQNIGETRRHGAELGVDAAWGPLTARVAYTYLRAVVGEAYETCIGTPCQAPANPSGPLPANYARVPAGSFLPAVPKNALYTGLTWREARWGWSTTVEAVGRSKIYADDRNSAAAGGYWLFNARSGFEQATAHWRLTEFARLDNLTNRTYVGSVIVNDSNSRFFEAAPGRTASIMFSASFRGD